MIIVVLELIGPLFLLGNCWVTLKKYYLLIKYVFVHVLGCCVKCRFVIV